MKHKLEYFWALLIWAWYYAITWLKLSPLLKQIDALFEKRKLQRDAEIASLQDFVAAEKARYDNDKFFVDMRFGKHRLKEDK